MGIVQMTVTTNWRSDGFAFNWFRPLCMVWLVHSIITLDYQTVTSFKTPLLFGNWRWWSNTCRYGRCFKTNIFGETHVFVSTATSTKTILNNDSGKFSKRYIRSIAQLVGDQSLLCASHQQHTHIRGHLSNFFSTCSLSAFIQQFDELIVKSLLDWEHRGTVVVLDEALKVILLFAEDIMRNFDFSLEKSLSWVWTLVIRYTAVPWHTIGWTCGPPNLFKSDWCSCWFFGADHFRNHVQDVAESRGRTTARNVAGRRRYSLQSYARFPSKVTQD